jgi:hypothetical protein
VSGPEVGALLRAQGFSLQGNAKVAEGVQHHGRDAQCHYLNEQVKEHEQAGEPVVSVDAKKKVAGELRNTRREWRLAGDPRRVEVHDYPDEVLGKVLLRALRRGGEHRLGERRRGLRHRGVRGRSDRPLVGRRRLHRLPGRYRPCSYST